MVGQLRLGQAEGTLRWPRHLLAFTFTTVTPSLLQDLLRTTTVLLSEGADTVDSGNHGGWSVYMSFFVLVLDYSSVNLLCLCCRSTLFHKHSSPN